MLSFIKKQKLKDKEMRILMLGLDGAGKSTIVNQLMGATQEELEMVPPTLGFIIRTYPYEDVDDDGVVTDVYRLNIWDVGGQKTLRAYWRNYFEKTDVLIWVVDSAARERMGECEAQLHELLKEERLMGASLLVFANKQDIGNHLTAEAVEETLKLPMLRSHNYHVTPCSAMKGTGVHEGIQWVVQDAKNRMFLY